tara:strand:- start:2049 stop:2288 length:240 start_codon:yes stop_codon:yes gene_type:complete
MPIRVYKEMRERIDMKKDIKKENYIYESPDNGKTIYRREIYDDVSGVKIDDADEKAINSLSKRVSELEEMVDKIRDIVR